MDKITTQSQETSADGGYSEKLIPLSSPFCKGGQETRSITPKRKFYTSSSGVTESPSKKRRTSENFKQKLMFWSKMEILEKSENLDLKHTSQSEAEPFSKPFGSSPSLSLGGGQAR